MRFERVGKSWRDLEGLERLGETWRDLEGLGKSRRNSEELGRG